MREHEEGGLRQRFRGVAGCGNVKADKSVYDRHLRWEWDNEKCIRDEPMGRREDGGGHGGGSSRVGASSPSLHPPLVDLKSPEGGRSEDDRGGASNECQIIDNEPRRRHDR